MHNNLKNLNTKVDSTSEKVLSKINAIQTKTNQELEDMTTLLSEKYMTEELTRDLLNETLTE